ncbi:unnamed protein product [Haemonchus placei]|uniref:alkaline phosphatase n=1 Tax=Haemonchus placei TaxID=6290 RepID=A0A0N4X1F1_HAEPC|nr:unnamed protein product [Haemonchus placei]
MSFWVLNLLCLLQIPTMASSKNVKSSDRYDLGDIRFWNSIGRRNIEKKLQLNPHLLKVKPPKNVIVFVGDGMGISTVTSARINKNQKAGIPHLNKPLYFEKFPYSGLVMTSSLDHHVTDSAASAMALFTGRKGVDRNAEYDEAEVRCARDIAKQLLSYPASEFKVLSRYILKKFFDVFQKKATGLQPSNVDVYMPRNAQEFSGIFSDSHFPYYLEEKLGNKKTVPRLHEMTKKAIEVLQKDDQGFFLMVEGGEIDLAEHENWMHVTFSEMYEFEEAVQVAREMTNPNETLIIVTADHGHSFTLPGYLHAKKSIFESSRVVHREGNTIDTVENWLPTLFFAVGPGYRNGFKEHPSNAEIEILETFGLKAVVVVAIVCMVIAVISLLVASFLASSLYSQNKDSSPQSEQMHDYSFDDEFQ